MAWFGSNDALLQLRGKTKAQVLAKLGEGYSETRGGRLWVYQTEFWGPHLTFNPFSLRWGKKETITLVEFDEQGKVLNAGKTQFFR